MLLNLLVDLLSFLLHCSCCPPFQIFTCLPKCKILTYSSTKTISQSHNTIEKETKCHVCYDISVMFFCLVSCALFKCENLLCRFLLYHPKSITISQFNEFTVLQWYKCVSEAMSLHMFISCYIPLNSFFRKRRKSARPRGSQSSSPKLKVQRSTLIFVGFSTLNTKHKVFYYFILQKILLETQRENNGPTLAC